MRGIAIECLEGRTLMAQTINQLLTQIQGDVASSKASIIAAAKMATTDEHTLAMDLKHTGPANAKLLKTLGKDFGAALANIRAMQMRANLIGLADLKKAVVTLNTAVAHDLSAKTLAAANKALAKLSKDDNIFVSPTVFNAFYAITAVPGSDEENIGSSNTENAAVTAALPALEAEANFSTVLYPEFNALVEDISTFATYVVNNISGTVF